MNSMEWRTPKRKRHRFHQTAGDSSIGAQDENHSLRLKVEAIHNNSIQYFLLLLLLLFSFFSLSNIFPFLSLSVSSNFPHFREREKSSNRLQWCRSTNSKLVESFYAFSSETEASLSLVYLKTLFFTTNWSHCYSQRQKGKVRGSAITCIF